MSLKAKHLEANEIAIFSKGFDTEDAAAVAWS